MKKSTEIGNSIRIARLLKGFSQQNMASELGMKQQSYQLIECGKTHITKDRLKQICDILEIEVSLIKVLSNFDLLIEIIKQYIKPNGQENNKESDS